MVESAIILDRKRRWDFFNGMPDFRIALALRSEIIQHERRLFLGVHRFAHSRPDWNLVWSNGTSRLNWETALNSKPDGILGVLLPSQVPPQELSVKGKPHIVILNTLPRCHHMVLADSVKAAKRGAAYLLERRIPNFAYAGWTAQLFSKMREESFIQALREAGYTGSIPIIEFQRPSVRPPNLNKHLKSLPIPCGVLCATDELALQMVIGALESGLSVPEDLAILGISNDEMVCLESPVPISSVEQHFEEVGFRAAQCMDDLLRGKQVPDTPILVPPGEVVERGSTRTLGVGDPLVRRALTIIYKPQIEPLTIPRLIEQLGGVSQRLLELRFKEVLNRSPYQEILHARIAHAKRLLRSTRMTLEEVAEHTGFGDPSIFSRHFRKICHQTPSQYSKEHFQERIAFFSS